MYSRKVDCETFYDRRESIGSTKNLFESECDGNSRESSDHYNPTLRLLQIPRSSNGSMGFHVTRSKWDPYPWISRVDSNTPAKFLGLKAGDCVLEVNGEDVLGMRITEIAELVNCETKSIDNVSLLLWNPGTDINCNSTNLCCGPMPLNLERLTAFTQTILALIECPVCLETIVPPILQCQNGHILCVKCRILSHTCPVCRQHFYPGQSLVAEQIYNSIMGIFNLRSQDKSQAYRCDAQRLFGAKYKRFSSKPMSTSSTTTTATKNERQQLQLRREKQQHNGICLKPPPPLEVNKFESQQPSTNKFLAKLLGRTYSMDDLNSPCRRRQSAPLLSLTRITVGRIANDNVGGANIDEDDSKANFNSTADFYKQLEFGYQCSPTASKPSSPAISKQFSLSAQDLSKKDNDRLIAIQQECLSKNSQQYLWLALNSVQMSLLPICPLQLVPKSLPLPSPPLQSQPLAPVPALASTTSLIDQQEISAGRVKHLKDGPSPELTKQNKPCCTEEAVFFCPLSCGKQFSGGTLQQHIKVDHSAPILCYNSSSAELALPLRAPLDKAAVLLMCDGNDFWIKLRTHGEENITALALFQGSEDESSDFMMETRLSIRSGKDQEADKDHDTGYVKIVVNNDNGILERELITRSIVHSMTVTTWEESYDVDACETKDEKCRKFFYNQENIRMAFGEAIDYRNIFLKIIIKRR